MPTDKMPTDNMSTERWAFWPAFFLWLAFCPSQFLVDRWMVRKIIPLRWRNRLRWWGRLTIVIKMTIDSDDEDYDDQKVVPRSVADKCSRLRSNSLPILSIIMRRNKNCPHHHCHPHFHHYHHFSHTGHNCSFMHHNFHLTDHHCCHN